MYEVAQIEGRFRYSAFKKTIKVMLTLTDNIDDLKTQLNKYLSILVKISIHVAYLLRCLA